LNRRVGSIPGRRFVFALALAIAAALSTAAPGQADQTVVRALVYDGSPGAAVPQQVQLSALSSCAPYSGPSPVYLYLGGPSSPPPSPYLLPSTTWTVATVVSCALQVPLNDVTAVQVAQSDAYRGYESPLTPAELTDPSQFQDPQAPGALPVVSTDGTEDQNTYTRPWLGGSDDNAADQVTVDNAPVTLAVYENAAPLVVHVSWTRVSQDATTVKIRFSATVHTESGTTVPAGALGWSWSFAAGAPSTAVTPTHTFPVGVAPVTVQVTDASAGTSGTATVDVSARASPASAKHTRSGGTKKTTSTSPVGSDHGSTSGGDANTGNTTTTTGATTATGATPTVHRTSIRHAATTDAARTPPDPPTRHHPAPPVVVQGTVVRGVLISDVKPDGSVLESVRSRTAAPPQVRQATQASPTAILLSGLVVVGLLGLGAGHELQSSRKRQVLRGGS
jgi:hypothetical protein